MTGKKFVPLAKHPGEMDAGDLRAALGGCPDSVVMRSLLVAEAEAIRNGAERETRTMRSLWYSLVKPALSRAGLLDAKTQNGKPIGWPAKLSVYLAELVRQGFTTYEKMLIVDGSRQRQPATAITRSPVTEVRLVGDHYPWLILFTEKDTIWGEVAALACLYGVSAISGGGEPSNACTENTVKAILENCAEGQALLILSLTDYDPYGYTIARAQFTQVREVAPYCEVYHERLGLTPDQLTPDELQANAYKPADQGLDEWLKETGGIYGQPLGLELDALPLSRLRAMFAEGIERYVDLDRRFDDLRLALVDLLACELLRPGFEAQRRALREATEADPVAAAIRETEIPRDLFRRAAAAGLTYIDPLEAGLFRCAGQVRQVMAAALGGSAAELADNGRR